MSSSMMKMLVKIILPRAELNLDFGKMKISSSKETKAPWWRRFVTEEDLEDREKGPKFVLLFAMLAQCKIIGDKM